jgi:hypothetical protein
LLQHADELLALLETAWLLGLVDPVRRTSIVRDCRRGLGEFKTLACQQRQSIGLLVRELNSPRKDGRDGSGPAVARDGSWPSRAPAAARRPRSPGDDSARQRQPR